MDDVVDDDEVEGEMTDFDKTFDTTIEHDRNNVTDEIISFEFKKNHTPNNTQQTKTNEQMGKKIIKDKQKKRETISSSNNNNNKQIKFRLKYQKL